jgi:GMP synthase (glutamine-hydrolysing)
LTCIFVNNGLLRAREAEVVQEVFGRNFKSSFSTRKHPGCSSRSSRASPTRNENGKIIGKTFIDVFQAATKRAGKAGSSPKALSIRMSSKACPLPAIPPPSSRAP